MSRVQRSFGFALLYSSLAWPGVAAAQAQDDVIVTAERRSQPIEEEASSISVLTREDLERLGAHHAAEALNQIPGVNYHRGSGVENLPAIRSPVLNGGAGAGSFLVLEDGVPVRAAPFANINQAYEANLEFAERLEVLRGPGTVVHGSNAVHGVVNVVTPAADEAMLRLEAETGSFGRSRGSLSAAGNGWLLGLAAAHEDGWRDNAGLGLQRALLGWDGAVSGWDFRLRASVSNLEQETAGFVLGARAYDNGVLARGNLNPEAFRDSRAVRGALTVSRRIGPIDATLTPFARRVDTDLLLHFFPSKALEDTEQAGGGLQSSFGWAWGPLDLLAGADFDHSRMSLRETQSVATVGTFPQGVHYDYQVDAHTRAAYAQATWRVDGAWSVLVGVRGEDISYQYDNHAPDGAFGRFLRAPDRSDNFSTLTARANAMRRFAGGAVAYASYTTGARPPQATDLYSLQVTQTPGEQGEEEITSAELGLRLPLGAGRLGLVLYDMHKRGGSFRDADGLTITDTRTRHRGVELEVEAPLTADVSASGWVSYADHQYAFDSPADGIARGARIESAPEWTSALQVLWKATDASEVSLEWRHVGPYLTEASGAYTYPGHDVLSLRGAWRLNASTEVFASVRNLTNTDYAERADFAFGNDRYFPGEDRSFSLGVRIVR